MRLISGQQFNGHFDIHDIRYALSMICRWAGIPGRGTVLQSIVFVFVVN